MKFNFFYDDMFKHKEHGVRTIEINSLEELLNLCGKTDDNESLEISPSWMLAGDYPNYPWICGK